MGDKSRDAAIVSLPRRSEEGGRGVEHPVPRPITPIAGAKRLRNYSSASDTGREQRGRVYGERVAHQYKQAPAQREDRGGDQRTGASMVQVG